MYNLRNRQPSMSTGSMSLGRGRGRGSGINPPSSLAIPNHALSSGNMEAHFSGEPRKSHDYFNARSTNSDSDELTQLRRQLDALKNENFELKRTAQQNSLRIPSSSQTNPNQNLVNTITQPTEQLGPIVYAGTHSYVNQDIASSKISQNPVINNNMNRYTQSQLLSNTYPNNTVQRGDYSQNPIPNSNFMQSQDTNSNFLQYPVQNRDSQQYQPITEPNLIAIQHPSGPQYINTSEVTRVNENGRRTRVPFYNGKDPWNAYVMQFELIVEMNNWSPSTKAIKLVTALKDEAMVYASFLTPETKRTYSVLCAAMSNRFGDHGYPET
ncbi:unnamed protein product [Mytilus coruscus]|uniref:Uncharacterized protein n=1 Tax=Mytilus coruscus TaxID=42192 RepID=A0A6J8DHR2_MYTCO|nr:unnamed protein product [Mytilus coruscus]